MAETASTSTRSPLASALWDLKVRLQFTGWLQYLPNALAVVVLGAIAAIGSRNDWAPALLWTPLLLASLLALNLAFDIVTVKLGVRPAEALPERRDQLDSFDLMRARVSCRSFQRRQLTPAHKAELLAEVARQTEPQRLLGDDPIRFEYVAAPLTVWPVVGAHEFLIAIAPKRYQRMAVIDIGRSLQTVVHHATKMGLATCWIGPGADHESIFRQLGPRFDSERDHVICVCAVGYTSRYKPLTLRLIQRMQRKRLPIRELFFAGADLGAPLDPDTPPFDVFGRCYEVCAWAPSSFNGQTTRAAVVVDAHGQPARVDFLAITNSRYYAPVALGIWLANWEIGCAALGCSGRFEVLSAAQRGVSEAPELPRYDISWVRVADTVA